MVCNTKSSKFFVVSKLLNCLPIFSCCYIIIGKFICVLFLHLEECNLAAGIFDFQFAGDIHTTPYYIFCRANMPLQFYIEQVLGAEVLHYPAVRYEREESGGSLLYSEFYSGCLQKQTRARLSQGLIMQPVRRARATGCLRLNFAKVSLALCRRPRALLRTYVYYDYNTCGRNFNKLPAARFCRRKKQEAAMEKNKEEPPLPPPSLFLHYNCWRLKNYVFLLNCSRASQINTKNNTHSTKSERASALRLMA